MNKMVKASLVLALGALLPAAANAASAQEVVKDARGNVVVNTHGNCVVTQWTSKFDDCRGGKSSILSKELRVVYFDFNKATLNTKEKGELDQVSKLILGAKNVESVEIVGFADEIGNASYNKALSTRRAEAVRKYLSTKGLKTGKVKVKGKGEGASVTKCDSKAARAELIACLAEDRRVEIEVNLKK